MMGLLLDLQITYLSFDEFQSLLFLRYIQNLIQEYMNVVLHSWNQHMTKTCWCYLPTILGHAVTCNLCFSQIFPSITASLLPNILRPHCGLIFKDQMSISEEQRSKVHFIESMVSCSSLLV